MNITDSIIIKYANPETGSDSYAKTAENLDMPLAEIVARIVPEGVEHTVIYEPRPTLVHIWVDDAWVLPPFDPGFARAIALSDLINHMNTFTAPFTEVRATAEVASWPSKAAGADAVLAGGDSTVVSAEANMLGLTITVVATAIAAKSELYLRIVGELSGIRQIAETALDAAVTQVEVDIALQAAIESLNQIDTA